MVCALLATPGISRAKPPVRQPAQPLFSAVRDANGLIVRADSDPATLLYSRVGLEPVLSPTGDHLTVGDWLTVSGRASAKCVGKGTHLHLELSGLLPNALYDLWISGDGFFGYAPSITGDPVPHSWVANGQGRAALNFIVPPGPLSVQGEVGSCLLDRTFFLIVLYHEDGVLYGDEPGPGNVALSQGRISFVQ